MATDVKELISQMPPLEGGWIKPTSWEGTLAACNTALETPKESVIAIIAAFGDVDNGKDYKARLLLRSVVTVAGNPENKGKLEAVVDGIASQLSGNRVKQVKAALIRELRFCGTPSASKAIAPFLTDEELCEDAANALRSIGEGSGAILLAALAAATGKCKTQIIHALAALQEKAAVAAFEAALTDKELDTRIAAAWGIARVADGAAADTVLKAADAASGWERVQMTNAALILAENLIASGKKGEGAKIYSFLKETRKDPSEAYLVDVATKALAG
jgi:HEAT repeat protein